MELLVPTLNKISSYQFLFILLEGENEQSSQTDHSTWCLPLKYRGNYFKENVSHGVTKFFGKICARLFLYGGTNV